MEDRDELLEKVRLGAEQASQLYYRLIVVIPEDKSKDSRYIAEGLGIGHINVGEKLGEKLMEIPSKRRPLKIAGLLEKLLDEVEGDRVLLDHIEIFFETSLKVEPLTLLRSASRRHLLIVMWSGGIEAGNLVYGFPGHPEYQSYPAQDVALVQFP